jgi:hypothetical protein
MKLNGAGALDDEHPQIAITTLGHAAKCGAITGRHLPRYQTQSGGKSRPSAKAAPSLMAATIALAMIGPMPDPLIEMCPILDQISDDSDHAGR